MSSFATSLWNFITVAIFLIVWDQLAIDKTLSIKSWTFTIEPFVARATPQVISMLNVVSSSASPRTRRPRVITPRRSFEPVVESTTIEGTIL